MAGTDRFRHMNRSTIRYSTLAAVGGFLALAAAAVGAAAGPLYRLELLALRDAFDLLRWAAYGGLAAAALSFVGMIRARPGSGRRGFVVALVGLCLGIATFWLPWSQQQQARRVPAIHDITTDPANPPELRAAAGLRAAGANSLEYDGPALARQQRGAYPDIRPADYAAPPTRVFEAALAAARGMGWRIVESDPGAGRIEAVATTFWFGFRDDVVVRVTDRAGGARVDVRSASRVGVSDVGKNAARIRAYLEALDERLPRGDPAA